MTAKSVLLHSQGLRPRARAPPRYATERDSSGYLFMWLRSRVRCFLSKLTPSQKPCS